MLVGIRSIQNLVRRLLGIVSVVEAEKIRGHSIYRLLEWVAEQGHDEMPVETGY